MSRAEGRRREGRTLARAIASGGVSPAAAAARSMSVSGSHAAALDAWVSAALSRSRLDAESRLTKLAVACAVLSALGSHRVLPYAEGGALIGSISGAPFSRIPGCGHGGLIVMARTARIGEGTPPDDAMRMAALVVPAAGGPKDPAAGTPARGASAPPVVPLEGISSQPRLERIYDTEALGPDQTHATISMFGNFDSFPGVTLPRTAPPHLWTPPRRPERIAIAVAELPAAATVGAPERFSERFHVPTLSSIERRFVPEMRMPEWAWGSLEAGEFAAEEDVVRLPLVAANEWAVRAFAAEHARAGR